MIERKSLLCKKCGTILENERCKKCQIIFDNGNMLTVNNIRDAIRGNITLFYDADFDIDENDNEIFTIGSA
jgi:recombinational DNA repair protein RecR